MSTATAILSVPNHPASHMKASSSISGASSVSILDDYSYSAFEAKIPTSTAMVEKKDAAVSSSSNASSRDTHATAVPTVSRCQQITPYRKTYKPPPTKTVPRAAQPHLIATISVGFERGDYLVREEKGFNVYFYFLEEAYNFVVQKGFSRMPKYEENDYMELIKRAQKSVPGGCRYNNGKLLMVLKKRLVPVIVNDEKSMSFDNSEEISKRRRKSNRNKKPKNLSNSSTTLPTDDETDSSTSNESCSYERSKSSTYEQSSCSTSYVDSWE
mmetsp:Transcript_15666/g.25750  ORF Transcript_15666/g.25750 Transcript_15666/m.25750 type:complete len:270 (+) Transcript_15666:125-934(+)|eukprot:scaffold444_cov135-Skeletonema_menzelii.AAC.3